MSNPYKMRLLANLPLYVDKISIYSPTLKSIAEVGLEKYNSILSNCVVTKDNVKITLSDNATDFDALKKLCLEHGFFYTFLYSLYFFTKLEFTPYRIDDDIAFKCNDIELNRNNYLSFINCVKWANCISAEEEEKELDEFDRRVLEMERKIKEAQSKAQKPYELEDLISALANMNGNGLNIINVWDLNIYQFYEQLKRGQKKEDYYLSIKKILAGANPDDIKIEHYFNSVD